MPSAAEEIRTTLVVEDGKLFWRVTGMRGKSPNRSRGDHWSKFSEDKMRWLATLMAAAGRHEVRHEWKVPFRARLTIREWGQPRDLDNAVAAQKWLIDALVAANYIVDDCPKNVIKLSIEQPEERPDWIIGNKRTPAVEIEIEPAD